MVDSLSRGAVFIHAQNVDGLSTFVRIHFIISLKPADFKRRDGFPRALQLGRTGKPARRPDVRKMETGRKFGRAIQWLHPLCSNSRNKTGSPVAP